MSNWTLSKGAVRDLAELYAYGFETFGESVADDYADSLRDCFDWLALNPRMGRPAETAGRGFRRLEHRRHVVFYEIGPTGIRIVAIIHERSIRGIGL